MREKILAIIPARSGSKGLKDKNIKNLNGKPLIAYTIEAAKESGLFEDILVSTDSVEYADISRQYGAIVPFLRDEKLSGDTASTVDVIMDVFTKMKLFGKEYDSFVLLQPTSPLRTEKNIIEAYNLFVEKSANSVVSVCEVDHNPLLTNLLPNDLSLDNFIKKENNIRRQDLGKYYRLNGAIYISKVDYYLKYKNFYEKNSFAYIMDKRNSVDIDDEIDFKLAEILSYN